MGEVYSKEGWSKVDSVMAICWFFVFEKMKEGLEIIGRFKK